MENEWRTMTQEERDRLESSQGMSCSRCLTPEEIRQLADPGNVMLDTSSNGNHGIVHGGAKWVWDAELNRYVFAID